MLPGVVMGCWNVLNISENWIRLTQSPRLLLCSFRPTFQYTDKCREIMERLVEENLAHSFCSTCKRNVTESVSWSVDELPKRFGVQLTKLKTQLLHCSTAVIEYWLCDPQNSVAVPVGMMNILLHLTKLPTQYQFVSVVCHVYWTDTPFGFCMLTSVDKMFIRFIFAKDMQLHYIWYYKILIKTCSCYPCEHLFILVWGFSILSLQIRLDTFSALQTLLHSTTPSLYISCLHQLHFWSTLPPAVKATRSKLQLIIVHSLEQLPLLVAAFSVFT